MSLCIGVRVAGCAKKAIGLSERKVRMADTAEGLNHAVDPEGLDASILRQPHPKSEERVAKELELRRVSAANNHHELRVGSHTSTSNVDSQHTLTYLTCLLGFAPIRKFLAPGRSSKAAQSCESNSKAGTCLHGDMQNYYPCTSTKVRTDELSTYD